MATKKEFKLVRPITVHTDKGAQKVSALQLREPSFGDCNDIGYHYQLVYNDGKPQGASYDSAKVGRWLERLSGYDEGVLAQLHAADHKAFADWLFLEFQGPDLEAPAEKNSGAPSESSRSTSASTAQAS